MMTQLKPTTVMKDDEVVIHAIEQALDEWLHDCVDYDVEMTGSDPDEAREWLAGDGLAWIGALGDWYRRYSGYDLPDDDQAAAGIVLDVNGHAITSDMTYADVRDFVYERQGSIEEYVRACGSLGYQWDEWGDEQAAEERRSRRAQVFG